MATNMQLFTPFNYKGFQNLLRNDDNFIHLGLHSGISTNSFPSTSPDNSAASCPIKLPGGSTTSYPLELPGGYTAIISYPSIFLGGSGSTNNSCPDIDRVATNERVAID